ncbi:MAG: hypothetical protein KTR31_25405 [Myxococcales bacterium]|nr:hypothetical protein [Myxococcales bacterium]
MIGGVLALGSFALLAMGWPLSAEASEGDEISRSRGRRGGVVVLWPRVVPVSDDEGITALAGRLQERAYAAASKLVSYKQVDVRPEPERACPRQGCKAPAVSLFLGHQEGGCVLVASVGPPGAERRSLLPLVGSVELGNESIAFREPMERGLVVREFVPCATLESQLSDELLEQAIGAYLIR